MRRYNSKYGNKFDQSSMADIGLLLLIFFLVSTTIDLEKGILVKLPPYDPDNEPALASSRNFCQIHLNAANEIMIEREYSSLEEIRPFVKKFILNEGQEIRYSQSPNKAVIAINNDRQSMYKDYLTVYNEVKKAYNELWGEKAKTLYSKSYENCTKKERKKIKSLIPLIISEMEPEKHHLEAK